MDRRSLIRANNSILSNHYNSITNIVNILILLLKKRANFFRQRQQRRRYIKNLRLQIRIKDAQLEVSRPKNIGTGVNDTFRHIQNRLQRMRDTQKCFNQKEVTPKRDRQTGLNTLQYEISGVNSLSIDGISIAIVNIVLQCDTKCDWCDCSGAAANDAVAS